MTPNFTLHELTRSDWAIRNDVPNTPTVEVTDNLHKLCLLVLEPLRTAVGRPIIVSSGYRSPTVNKAVGGAANSAHLTGRAADINAVGMNASALARFIRRSGITVDKCIDEFGSWVHVQIASGTNFPRNEFLIAKRVNGRTVYEVMT